MMGLTSIGLALFLLLVHRRGWLYKLGGLLLYAGTLLYFVTRMVYGETAYGDAVIPAGLPHVAVSWVAL